MRFVFFPKRNFMTLIDSKDEREAASSLSSQLADMCSVHVHVQPYIYICTFIYIYTCMFIFAFRSNLYRRTRTSLPR